MFGNRAADEQIPVRTPQYSENAAFMRCDIVFARERIRASQIESRRAGKLFVDVTPDICVSES
jgi:hypothetical protein